MANIKINDLKVTGSELFVDQESFLNDLSDSDLTIQGGYTVAFTRSVITTEPIYEN